MPEITTNPTSVSTGTIQSGSSTWSNASNALTDDTNAASTTISLAASPSDSLDFSGLNLSLPLTAHPTSISFQVRLYRTGLIQMQDYQVRLANTSKTGPSLESPTALSTTATTLTYTDTSSWSRTETLSPSFGPSLQIRYTSGLGSASALVEWAGNLKLSYETKPLKSAPTLACTRFTRAMRTLT